MYNGSNILVSSVGGASGDVEICNMWQEHYSHLLNSNNDTSKCNDVLQYLTASQLAPFDTYNSMDRHDISRIIKDLKSGKSMGLDGLQSEHFKFAHETLHLYLCMIFKAIFTHGFIPDDLMQTVIVPIIKVKRGVMTDKDNYRPIAVTTVASKILELIILKLAGDLLETGDNQFGFKAKHSTDQCLFAFKQVVEYYTSSSSPVYICYMDASKAFDKVCHWNLFYKLTLRKIPPVIIRLLVYWYTMQTFRVRWGSKTSPAFRVTNGVRQGGILSPILFSVYTDDLSIQLSNSRIGCQMNGVMYNHFMYADDTVICAPCPSALQELLKICENHALDNGVLYNVKKTVCMCIKPKLHKRLHVPTFYLNGKSLAVTQQQKYLGVIVTDDLSDDLDIQRQLKAIYSRGNMLIKKFHKCSDDVKLQLFKSYCTNFYAVHLWCNYKKTIYDKVRVAFNNILRRLMNIRRDQSISGYLVQNELDNFKVLLRKSMYRFKSRIDTPENILVRNVAHSIFFQTSRLNLLWCKEVYKLDQNVHNSNV